MCTILGITTLLVGCPKLVDLATVCWGQSYIGYFMMVADFRCCWQNHYVADFFRYVGDFLKILNGNQHRVSITNISNLSPLHLVSNIGHQHRCNRQKHLYIEKNALTGVNNKRLINC